MKNLKNMMATGLMVAVMMVGTAFADGIIVGDLAGTNNQNPCSAQTKNETVKVDSGIIVAGLTGIIVAGFTGIIVGDLNGEPTVNCGIIVGD